MKKVTKTDSGDEMKRYLGALNEQHGDNLQAIREMFEVNTKRFESIDKRFDKIKETLDSHTNMVGQLMVDMTEVKNGFKAKVSQDDFAKLEKRVVRLETKVR